MKRALLIIIEREMDEVNLTGYSVLYFRSPFFISIFLIVCFTSYFMFSIAVLPHSSGIVYYHLAEGLLLSQVCAPSLSEMS